MGRATVAEIQERAVRAFAAARGISEMEARQRLGYTTRGQVVERQTGDPNAEELRKSLAWIEYEAVEMAKAVSHLHSEGAQEAFLGERLATFYRRCDRFDRAPIEMKLALLRQHAGKTGGRG